MSYPDERDYPYRAPYDPAQYRPPMPPQVPQEAPGEAPRPLATVAAVIGIVGPPVGFFGPAICWPVPAALGAIALLLALVASQVENRASIAGLLGGAVSCVVAVVGYQEWRDAVTALEGFGF